jgi:hypothetical protein
MFAASKTNAVASATDITYIEDVFSAYLYAGNSSTQTITNGIDLSTKGGLVWIKDRTTAKSNVFFDTNRGVTKYILSDSVQVQTTDATTLTAFNTTGFSLGADTTSGYVNRTSNYVSWTFRKQPKFFDVVTYTGTGANRTISHSLGSVPACIMVKRLSASTGAWQVYHRSLANTQYMVLNTTALVATGATRWNSTTPTSSVFSVGTDATVNASGSTYVAYIFAHDAGGFGLTGSDNVISCGAFTTDGSGQFAQVNLGYEPQFVLIKNTSGGPANWKMFDNIRGLSVDLTATQINNAGLFPNLSNSETTESNIQPNATGFISTATNSLEVGANFIYIAIRRGPMKIPTVGTSVFHPNAGTINNGTTITNGFPIDLQIGTFRDDVENRNWRDRLRGYPKDPTSGSGSPVLLSNSDIAESSSNTVFSYNWTNTGATAGTYPSSGGPFPQVQWLFRRAPSFFDQVCYTGTGANANISHNLKVVPELIIVKARNAATSWPVYSATTGNANYLLLNSTSATTTGTTFWNSTTPTSSVFTVGTDSLVNANTIKFVAYLFATCAGVSKVGSYSGNGGSQTINCGFTGGARFVLIKRSSTSGSWYVWDTARGIVTGNDPYLILNTDATETPLTDYIDPASSGFIVNNGGININATGSTYIFLAIA